MKTKNNERIPGELIKMKDNKRSPENRRNEQQGCVVIKNRMEGTPETANRNRTGRCRGVAEERSPHSQAAHVTNPLTRIFHSARGLPVASPQPKRRWEFIREDITVKSRRTLEELQREMKAKNPESPRGPGRPPLPIDGQIVKALACQGFNLEEIAATIPCDPKTLRQRFPQQLAEGKASYSGTLKIAANYAALNSGHLSAFLRLVRLRSSVYGRTPAASAEPSPLQAPPAKKYSLKPKLPRVRRSTRAVPAATAKETAQAWSIIDFEL